MNIGEIVVVSFYIYQLSEKGGSRLVLRDIVLIKRYFRQLNLVVTKTQIHI